MSASIQTLKKTLAAVFQRFPEVKFAYLFGSVAEGEDGPLSDIDLAVYLKPYSPTLHLRLHTELCRALKRDDVDLLVLNRTRNLILLDEIVRRGLLLFDRDPEERKTFEVKILHQALDFRAHRRSIMGL